MSSLTPIVGFCVHLAIGAGLGAIFLSVAAARSYRAQNDGGARRVAVHCGAIVVAAGIFLPVMMFVGSYQPRSWLNLMALAGSAIFIALFGWRRLFGAER